MKRQIRRGVFETNSSSMHVIVMCMESDYDRWQEDNLYLFTGSGWCYPDNNKPKRIISILEKKRSNLRRQTNM